MRTDFDGLLVALEKLRMLPFLSLLFSSLLFSLTTLPLKTLRKPRDRLQSIFKMSYRDSFSHGRGSHHYGSGGYGSGGYGSGGYGPSGYRSDDFESDSSKSSRSSFDSRISDGYGPDDYPEENAGPANTVTSIHHHFHQYHHGAPPNPDHSALERANYQQNRGDHYEAAYNQAHQRAELYHADRDEYGQRYYNERYQHQRDNHYSREAQRYQYYRGYEDGFDDAYEDAEQAVLNQRWQYQRARSDDARRYTQGVREAYVHGHVHGEQRARQPRETPRRRTSPNNHSHRVTYQDNRGNDAAFTDGNQWHGYVETEPDD